MRLRADLQREHERKMTELREASRRLKEDCDHKVELERYSQLLELCTLLLFSWGQFNLYPSGLFHWYWGNQMNAPVPVLKIKASPTVWDWEDFRRTDNFSRISLSFYD